MTTYLDSSALVSVYVTERFSKTARATVRGASQVPFTPLHQLEVPNAFEMLVGRAAMTRDECHATFLTRLISIDHVLCDHKTPRRLWRSDDRLARRRLGVSGPVWVCAAALVPRP